MAQVRETGEAGTGVPRWGGPLLLLGLFAFVALRAFSIGRAPFNWDEFALFDGVARSLENGVLRSGGRPGLAQLLVMPLVDGCRDPVAVALAARGLWLGITLAYLAGLFALLREWLRESPHRLHDACLGVALLGLLPVFLEWSLQVRTDQIALLGAAWGGFALLRSERNPGVALLAGMAFGLGWLSSQKLAYAAALVATLAAGRLLVVGGASLRREAWRGALAVAGFGTVWLCFRAFLMAEFTLPETHPALNPMGAQIAAAQGRLFPFYRNTIGYSQYVELLPTLVPHALLLAAGLGAGALAWRRGGGSASARRAAVVAAVLAVGAAVALFHAAAFSYFWMTLGLFPAVAGALAADPARAWIAEHRPGWLRPAAILLWAAIAIPAVLASAALLRDAQAVQRESLAFVQRNFADDQTGFHPEGALFCAAPQGLGIWFSQRLYRTFESDGAEASAARVERYFREQPVHYLLQSFRLNQFPLELRRFFAAHYQPYRDAVFVAGSQLSGEEQASIELLVDGPYRWIPFEGAPAAEVDGRVLPPGAIVELHAGTHTARVAGGGAGILVLALHDPPGPAPLPFYEPS